VDKFIPCEKCDQGYIYSRIKHGEATVIECECHKLWYDNQLLQYKIKESGLSESVKDYSINDYKSISFPSLVINHIREYVDHFDSKFYQYHLYFWSKENSTQKTTVASWIGKKLLETSHTVKFILMNDLIKLILKANFNEKDSTAVEEYTQCDFLIIDEAFDTSKVTLYKSGFQIPFLDSFLRKRMGSLSKATCFTSNISIEEIGKTFSLSLEKFIERSIIDPMHFKDEINCAILNNRITHMWEQ